MAQLIINIINTTFILINVSVSFTFIYYSTKFFNLFHATIITISAYFVFLFSIQLNLNLYVSIVLSILLSSLIGILSNAFLFKPLRIRNADPFLIMIASLGLYLVFQNIISLIWGDATKSIRPGEIKIGNEIFGAYITNVQIITIIVILILFLGTILFLNKSNLGKQMRAVSSNNDLSIIFGINSNKVILWSFGLGSALAAVAGILVAFDTDMTPTMGFNLLLYGIVAMIIGGVGSFWGLVGGAFLLATAQNLGAYYFDSKWLDAIAYIILILFLIWKPLGFSGKQLKKIEI